MQVRKVVIPVAGWGTRSLPASKNIPKEMLPIYDKPAVQYIVEEAITSGIKDVVFVTSRDKRVIEDYFDYNLQLEAVLERSGKQDKLALIREVAEMANCISVRQKKQLGLGHAVLCAKEVVGNEPFVVMVGDDLLFGAKAGTKQLLEVAAKEKKPVIGIMEVPRERVSSYGIVAGTQIAEGVYSVDTLVEKPAVDKAPSNLAIIGRYVLTPDIFDILENIKPGHGGEIQLTDALQELAKSRGLLAVKIQGQRFDAGDWSEYLAANIYYAMQDDGLCEDLMNKLNPILEMYR